MSTAERRIFVAILVVAFCLRLAVGFYWHQLAVKDEAVFRLGDSHSYWTLAEHIAAGEPYQYGSENASIFRAPLYPLFLSAFTFLQPESTAVLAARIAGCCLGTVAVWLLMVLASRIGGTCAALACGALAAIHPGAIGMSVIILSEALFMPLMVAHLLLWQSAWRAETRRWMWQFALLGGIVAGLAVLARPSWLLFIPFAAVVGAAFRGNRRRHLAIAAISLCGLSLVMSPWWFRNATITGRFVPTTLQVGPSLYDGLHAGATGASDEGMQFSQRLLHEQLAEDLETLQANLEVESTIEYRVNQRATRQALQWAAAHPAAVAQLAFKKFQRTWSLWPDGGEMGSTAIRLAITVGGFGILLLATGGSLVAIRPFNWLASICWLPCLYFTCLHMVFVGSVRYREPAIFVLCVLAGYAIAWVAGCYSNQQCLVLPPSEIGKRTEATGASD